MRFSVIIPAYNCAKTIEDTVNSIFASGLTDFEILIVDDGSNDGTDKVCDALSEKHEYIRCIHQENAGVSAARNRGIEESTGEYILFFDSDDSVDKNAFCHAVEIIEEVSPDMLIFGESFDYYHNGKMYRRDELCYPEEVCLDAEQWSEKLEELFDCNALSPVWNKFIKREILINNNIRFDGEVFEMEDFLFSIKCLKHCEKVYVLPEVIYRYRQAEDERSTYNRLCRVDSLTEYMKPFEEAVAELKNGKKLVEQIYAMLFNEQIRFADAEKIKTAAEDMLNGKYASVIKEQSPELFADMQNGNFEKIHMQRLKSRLRHFAAVRYKYLRSL